MNSIKMNAQGIEAILNGSKTMTRRPIRDEILVHKLIQWKTIESINSENFGDVVSFNFRSEDEFIKEYSGSIRTKYKIGEIVQVTEPFDPQDERSLHGENVLCKLKITDIKVERLQDISEEDCIAEGIENLTNYDPYELRCKSNTYRIGHTHLNTANGAFALLWYALLYKKPYDWGSNPYVFVYEFEVVK